MAIRRTKAYKNKTITKKPKEHHQKKKSSPGESPKRADLLVFADSFGNEKKAKKG